MTTSTIAERVRQVRLRVAAAASASGRDPETITLIAVGKTHPPELLAAAVEAGVRDLGENRIQEAEAKRGQVPPATWHLIGPLQRNKARRALELFDLVHTLDRPRLVERLDRLLEEHWPQRRLPVLIEVNVGHEEHKAGVAPEDAEPLLRSALSSVRLRVDGLMAIPPFGEDPEASRPHFRALCRLRDHLQQRLGAALPHLSMGMTHDFEIAIAEGATMVRVGTAIFGPRATRTKVEAPR